MKNFLLKYAKNPILVIFLFIVLIYGVPALAKTSQIDDYAVVIGVGIDLGKEKKYDVSFLTFVPVPDQNFTERYKVVSAEGDSIAKATNDAELYVGKSMRFAHIKTIGLGKELLDFEDDISNLLDFLIRENDVSASTKIVATQTSVKDFLEEVKVLDSESSTKISQLATYNQKGLFGVETTFEDFYKGMLGPQKVSLVPVFDLDTDDGLSPSASGEGQSKQGGSGQSSSEKKIVNTGEAILIKNGKKVGELSSDEVKDVNLLLGNYSKSFLTIKGFEGETYKNSDLCFEIFGNTTRYNVTFQNGVPVVSVSIKMQLALAEVVNENGVITKNTNIEMMSDKDFSLVENQIREDISKGVNTLREKRCDLAGFYTKIYNKNRKKFEQFLSVLSNEDDFLDNIVVKANISIKLR